MKTTAISPSSLYSPPPDLIKYIAELELRQLYYEAEMAEIKITIGKELIKLDEAKHDSFEVCKTLMNHNGEPRISARNQVLFKKIARIKDIDLFKWLGWNNIVSLTDHVDMRKSSSSSIKRILSDIGIDVEDRSPDNIRQALRKIGNYPVYIEIKKLNKDLTFSIVDNAIEKGVTFSKEQRQKIKESKNVATTIRNFYPKQDNLPNKLYIEKARTPSDEIEKYIVQLAHAISYAFEQKEDINNVRDDSLRKLFESTLLFVDANSNCVPEIMDKNLESDKLVNSYIQNELGE